MLVVTAKSSPLMCNKTQKSVAYSDSKGNISIISFVTFVKNITKL